MSALHDFHQGQGLVTVELTPEEAHELFSRCLDDTQPDSDLSRIVLKKLARALFGRE